MWYQLTMSKTISPEDERQEESLRGGKRKCIKCGYVFFFVLNLFLSTLSFSIEKWSNRQRTNGAVILRRGQGKGSSANYSIGPPGG